MQEVLDTGRYWRKPGIPIFERTTIKNYHAVKLDITDLSDIQSAFTTALDKFGGVDEAVNNAGPATLRLLIAPRVSLPYGYI